MSTTTLNPTAPTTPALPARAIIRRFAWKEYRVLRPLWLAVALLGVLVQITLNALLPPGPRVDDAMILFIVAWGAAILYAAGAAAATFSVEHEEETYGFLSGLPTTWWPMFVGKLTVAAASAFALAAVLIITIGIVGARFIPTAQNAGAISAACGVAVLEAVAWGTLFSLLTKRPLVAAMLTLIVGATAMHLAVNLSSSSTIASLNLNSYLNAIPLRLAIVAAVLAASAAVARRWLPQQFPCSVLRGGARGGASGEGSSTFRVLLSFLSARIASPIRSITTRTTPATRGTRRRQTARLLWQTWRESWLWLPLPIVVGWMVSTAAGLMIFLAPFSGETESFLILSTAFFIPTLYGAMAFSADQRRASYRFLAEHAARPRYVWLARHAVWLGSVVVVTVVAACAAAALVGVTFQTHMTDFVRHQESYGSNISAVEISSDLFLGVQIALRVISLAACGVLVAYALGQFWSMLMRSEIIAAFTAIVLSVGLAAWVALLFVWELPGRIFLLPIFVGLLFATWLRAPAWIADRRTWRAWFAPSLAVAVPLILIAAALPTVRLSQLPTSLPSRVVDQQSIAAEVAITNHLDWLRDGDSPAARETAAMYFRAADLLGSWLESDPLERWSKPEYMEAVGGEMSGIGGMQNSNIETFGIDEKKIPPDELDSFRKAKKELEELALNAANAARELATEASLRPSCHFHFDLAQVRFYATYQEQPRDDLGLAYRQLIALLDAVEYAMVPPEKRLDQALTALRMTAHFRSGQPSSVFFDQMLRERQTLQQIGEWALNDDRTTEELRAAREKLENYFRSARVDLAEPLMADHLLVRDVLVGDQYPFVMQDKPVSNSAYLAYLANQLPWERERGERALNVITLQNIRDAGELTVHLSHQKTEGRPNWWLRRWLRPIWLGDESNNWGQNWIAQQPAAATSYLTRLEYQRRVQVYNLNRALCDSEVYRRATLLELALAMYRRDHDTYPKSLAELVPDYLAQEPRDPYTNQSFQYVPHGLDLKLERRNYPYHDQIEPQTPLLWSVGLGNAQMKSRQSTSTKDGEVDAQGEPLETTETIYELHSEDPQWWNEPTFVFPLPK